MIFLKLETPYLKKGHGDLDAENNSKDNLEKPFFDQRSRFQRILVERSKKKVKSLSMSEFFSHEKG